jgi:KipI family sensor histidine kinase inhibitor
VSGARACAFGDDAIYLDLGELAASERAARTLAAASALRQHFASAEVVVGAGTVAVHGVPPTVEALAAAVAVATEGIDQRAVAARGGRLHEVGVVYDGADLDEVAARAAMPAAAVIRLHASREYLVELVGFLPGFGYLGPLDPRLQLPRRPSPRARVPAGSVAIADAFTGVYPAVSPGGWHLLGRAVDFVAFDPSRAEPSLLSPGDQVRFVPVAANGVASRHAPAASSALESALEAIAGATLEIVSAAPGTTVQDLGRRSLSRGVPPSGPLDPETYAAATSAVGNRPGAAAIEVPHGRLEVVARGGSAIVSIDGAHAQVVAPGESLILEPGETAVRYLAVRGGLDVAPVLGSRATLMSAKLGGLDGRALRAGDQLPIGESTVEGASVDGVLAASARTSETTALQILRGPHVERFAPAALQTLTSTTWRVSRLGDRVGVRLDGGAVPREGSDSALPAPMVRGAVQVATDGTPIVLGPDHPVTGGYPVLAVLRKDAQRRLAQLRPGARIRFVLVRESDPHPDQRTGDGKPDRDPV